MPIKKYINTAEVATLTGLQQDDIRNLAKTNGQSLNGEWLS